MASDGIPIRGGEQEEEEVEELQYEWSTEGERELPAQQEAEEERLEPVMAVAGVVVAGAIVAGLAVAGDEVEEVEEVEQLEEVEELFERRSREPSGEPGQDSEPGYDLVRSLSSILTFHRLQSPPLFSRTMTVSPELPCHPCTRARTSTPAKSLMTASRALRGGRCTGTSRT